MKLTDNDLHCIFCSFSSKLEELAEYFQDKYNFDTDNEDIDAIKETIMEIANDIPKVVSISLYGQDITKDKKIIAEGALRPGCKLCIFVNDDMAAHKIICDLEYIAHRSILPISTNVIERIVANATKDRKFKLCCAYELEFDKDDISRVHLDRAINGYEIVFPSVPIKRGCD